MPSSKRCAHTPHPLHCSVHLCVPGGQLSAWAPSFRLQWNLACWYCRVQESFAAWKAAQAEEAAVKAARAAKYSEDLSHQIAEDQARKAWVSTGA